MLKSMTGFGRSSVTLPSGKIVAEIQSLNRKFMETFVSMPRELSRFEMDLRKSIADKIHRGQVSLRLSYSSDELISKEMVPPLNLLKALKEGWVARAKELQLDPTSIDIPFLAQMSRTITASPELENEKEYQSKLLQCLDAALTELLQMKQKEGEIIAKDIHSRLITMEQNLNSIEQKTPEAAKRYREKLIERMKELLSQTDEERILKEVAIYAEKVDITEEILRFRSHLKQFHSLLNKEDGSVGRKMDFLAQEMGREINTIGAKSNEVTIAEDVVDIKSDLDKIREQIQNIE